MIGNENEFGMTDDLRDGSPRKSFLVLYHTFKMEIVQHATYLAGKAGATK
jgi:hypothetical protein